MDRDICDGPDVWMLSPPLQCNLILTRKLFRFTTERAIKFGNWSYPHLLKTEDVLVYGFYLQMSMRLRCDRKHDPTYESVCKSGKRSGLVDERNFVRKGALAACMALQLASCRLQTLNVWVLRS